MTFSTPFMERATRSSKFYAQINLLIDQAKIETLINRYYTKGNTLKEEKPYGGPVLFKMLLKEIWNDLSDVQTKDLLNDSVSAMRFLRFGFERHDSPSQHIKPFSYGPYSSRRDGSITGRDQ